jgi:hypothetical protein
MPADFSTDTVLRRLDHGESVFIPSSTRHIVLTLVLALVIGAGLLVFLAFIVISTLSDGRGWGVIVFNLRMWALAIGIIGCLIVAPIGAAIRMNRQEALVVSPDGVSLARRGRVLPGHLLLWHDMKAVVFERAVSRGPKVLAYILTEEATRRLRGRGLNPRWIVRSGFVLSHRRLYPLLAAAHARYSAHLHDDR